MESELEGELDGISGNEKSQQEVVDMGFDGVVGASMDTYEMRILNAIPDWEHLRENDEGSTALNGSTAHCYMRHYLMTLLTLPRNFLSQLHMKR